MFNLMTNPQPEEMNFESLAKVQRHLRFMKGYISQERDASTRDASELLILNALDKLSNEGSYSIGGTRTEARPDFWFHFTTSCYGKTFLLNLFIRVSWPGRYIVKYISNRKLKLRADIVREIFAIVGYGDIKERSFKTTRDNEQVYLMTYEFKSGVKLSKVCQTLIIPIGIKDTVPVRLVNFYVRRVMDTRLETADFTIISNTNVKHRIHSIALEEHSPAVLKNQVCSALEHSQTSLHLDINDHDMIALTEFIYMNEIYTTVDFMDIVNIAAKFGLTKLYDWVENNLRQNISYTNAREIGKLAVKCGWKKILQLLFEYINALPETLQAFGVKDEVDKTIIRAFLHYTYRARVIKL